MIFYVHRKTEGHLELVAGGTTTTAKQVSCVLDFLVVDITNEIYLPSFGHLEDVLLDDY